MPTPSPIDVNVQTGQVVADALHVQVMQEFVPLIVLWIALIIVANRLWAIGRTR